MDDSVWDDDNNDIDRDAFHSLSNMSDLERLALLKSLFVNIQPNDHPNKQKRRINVAKEFLSCLNQSRLKQNVDNIQEWWTKPTFAFLLSDASLEKLALICINSKDCLDDLIQAFATYHPNHVAPLAVKMYLLGLNDKVYLQMFCNLFILAKSSTKHFFQVVEKLISETSEGENLFHLVYRHKDRDNDHMQTFIMLKQIIVDCMSAGYLSTTTFIFAPTLFLSCENNDMDTLKWFRDKIQMTRFVWIDAYLKHSGPGVQFWISENTLRFR